MRRSQIGWMVLLAVALSASMPVEAQKVEAEPAGASTPTAERAGAEIVSGRQSAEFSPEKRSAFVFRGIAVGDFALAALAYERAKADGRGQAVSG